MSRIAGHFPQERFADTLSDSSSSDSCSTDADEAVNKEENSITVRVSHNDFPPW